MKIDLKPNEIVVKAADSNHLINKSEKIKGKLIVTNQRLYFKHINGAPQDYDMEINPKDIRDVLFFNSNLFSPNGLNIITKAGKEIKFLLKKRNILGEMIVKMC